MERGCGCAYQPILTKRAYASIKSVQGKEKNKDVCCGEKGWGPSGKAETCFFGRISNLQQEEPVGGGGGGRE